MFTFELVWWANSSAPMYWECSGDAIDREPMVTLQTTCNISTANNDRYNRGALLDTIYRHFDVTVMRSFLLSLRIKTKWISNVNQEKYFISMFTFELVWWANSSAPMYWECSGDAIDREPMVTLQTTCNISTANNDRYNRGALLDTIYRNQGKHWSLSNDILKVDDELVTRFNPVCKVKTELAHLQVNA